MAIARLEGEEFVVFDRGEALAGACRGSDFDALVKAQVVDDLDAGEGDAGIDRVAHAPAADAAAYAAAVAHAGRRPAQKARALKLDGGHDSRYRGAPTSPDSTVLLRSSACGARV